MLKNFLHLATGVVLSVLGWYFDKIFIMCPKTQHLELQLITLKNYETFFGGFAKGQ